MHKIISSLTKLTSSNHLVLVGLSSSKPKITSLSMDKFRAILVIFVAAITKLDRNDMKLFHYSSGSNLLY